jgi:hypothetical protein
MILCGFHVVAELIDVITAIISFQCGIAKAKNLLIFGKAPAKCIIRLRAKTKKTFTESVVIIICGGIAVCLRKQVVYLF